MPVKTSPLHFHPLRPSRNQLEPVSWASPEQRSTSSSPFAYLHEPYLASPPVGLLELHQLGHYDEDAQVWVFPEDAPTAGVSTKCYDYSHAISPGTPQSHDDPDYQLITDDACF